MLIIQKSQLSFEDRSLDQLPDMMAHVCNPRLSFVMAERFQIQGQLELPSKLNDSLSFTARFYINKNKINRCILNKFGTTMSKWLLIAIG